jgi:hypothetical protein
MCTSDVRDLLNPRVLGPTVSPGGVHGSDAYLQQVENDAAGGAWVETAGAKSGGAGSDWAAGPGPSVARPLMALRTWLGSIAEPVTSWGQAGVVCNLAGLNLAQVWTRLGPKLRRVRTRMAPADRRASNSFGSTKRLVRRTAVGWVGCSERLKASRSLSKRALRWPGTFRVGQP